MLRQPSSSPPSHGAHSSLAFCTGTTSTTGATTETKARTAKPQPPQATPTTPREWFILWLTEWIQDINDLPSTAPPYPQRQQLPGNKLIWTYRRALTSLQSYKGPALQNGLDATRVPYIGPGIAQRLQTKWQKHAACDMANQDSTDQLASASSSSDLQSASKKSQISSATSGKNVKGKSAVSFLSLSNLPTAPSPLANIEFVYPMGHPLYQPPPPLPENNTLSANAPKASKPPKAPKAKKAYVPKYGSGGYAILITLHAHAGTRQFMTRPEIISLAQNHCSSSFTTAAGSGGQGGRSFYTAWSSMETLIKQDLVYKSGSPAKYSLTEEGALLAARLHAVSVSQKFTEDGDSDVISIHSSNSDIEDTVVLGSNANRVHEDRYDENDVTFIQGPLFQYLNSQNTLSLSRESSETMSFNGVRYYKITFDRVLEGLPTFQNIIPLDSEDANFRRAFLPEAFAPPIPPSLQANKKITPVKSLISEAVYHPYAVREELFMFPAGSFEICLVLDNREVAQRSNRTYFQSLLTQKGVPHITRCLELGDFNWIAKKKGIFSLKEEEILLDIIVERKTVVDLISSIKDGRFREQKFRLKKCGISHVIYLVEESNAAEAAIFGVEAIQTAVTSTQLHSGFTVKRVKNCSESIEYLGHITEFLHNMLKDTDLHAFRTGLLQKKTFLQQKKEIEAELQRPIHLTFADFHSLNCKTKLLTVRDIWTKQLMTIRGLSLEKVLALVRTYPTCSHLLNALLKLPTEKERIDLLTCANDPGNRPSGKRALTKSLAQKIIHLFTANAYD